MHQAGEYDICVIGAGHAGIEAALAAARLGARVLCTAINLDTVGNLPCNPSIGGTSKGCLVREVDALGGEMGKAADATCIQFRMLNRGKGPAVQSPRAQADRRAYQDYMKRTLERQEGLSLKQAEIVEIMTENGAVSGVRTRLGAAYRVKAVVIASGTYLKGRVIVGDCSYESGPDGLFPANALSESLRALGIRMQRFKTGTPPRVLARSVDFSRMQRQEGERDLAPFSFATERLPENVAVCWLTYTDERTHRVIRENLHRSPLFSGEIEGTGPRYCPSIEDKVVRFADKERHPVFVEPMGLQTEEMYLQGLSSSLPEDVQEALVHTVPGLERAELTRPGYAIEYDCADPLEFLPTLACKRLRGLYGAGQFCGTSGYEEAAAMGLVAGVNALRYVNGQPEITIGRDEAYIGVLIDDLVTRGTSEPYRMMTSRAEYRLILRQDNADRRLSRLGHAIGLLSAERAQQVEEKYARVERELDRLRTTSVAPSPELNAVLEAAGSPPLETGIRLYQLLKRPGVSYRALQPFDPERPALSGAEAEQVEIAIRYEGYIKRQRAEAEALRRQEAKRIPEDIDYLPMQSIRIEARQKLDQVRPRSIGQAARISGVNPVDITALLLELGRRAERKAPPGDGTDAEEGKDHAHV